MKFDIRLFLENLSKKFKSEKNTGYFTWGPEYFRDNISLNSSQKRYVSHKICIKNQNTYFMSSDFFSPENRAV